METESLVVAGETTKQLARTCHAEEEVMQSLTLRKSCSPPWPTTWLNLSACLLPAEEAPK
jgi:hypothetical protein